jgi:translation initiation factor IF-2
LAEKNRVYEIAKAHGTTSKAILNLLQELGVVAKSHMSVLSDDDLELVERHFRQLEERGEKVVEKTARVEVEKARSKPKRMSAREKIAAKKREKEEARRRAQEQASATEAEPAPTEAEPAEAPAPKRTIQKVEAPKKAEPVQAADETPAEEGKKLQKVTPVKPAEVVDDTLVEAEQTGGPVDEEAVEETVSGESEAAGSVASESAAAADQERTEGEESRPLKTQQRLDLKAIARAAAKTRERIADDMRTRMAEPEPQRPARGERPAPTPRGRPGKVPPKPTAGAGGEEAPKPIDPNSIRNSVRKALGGINVSRGRDRGPGGGAGRPAAGPAGRRRGRVSIRDEKRAKVERHRAREEALQAKENEIRITEFITVGELAEKLDAKPQQLIMKLMGLGVMATMNQRLERDQIEMILADYEDIEVHWLDTAAGEDIEVPTEDDGGEKHGRPPVVTVMGHVDHGKTTLLDYLRKTKVTAGESGGITQHIGAYQVETERGKITFLDTPGHEAFTAMRARGARVTDIVVVVVAADDKVMPQTVEAIDHARASDCPIIIAINKVDLPAADPDGVKQALMQHNVLVEDFGGDVQAVEVSAKKGTNIEALLESIQLQAEIMELEAVGEGRARGTVVEARKDLGRGAVFTVLVTKGTLHVGDPFVVGSVDGRVRAMLDEFDQPVESAGPSRPVLVLGASDVPRAGDQMDVVPSDSEAKEIARKRQVLQREQTLHAPKKKATLESLFDRMQSEEAVELNLLVKGDVSGSVEAVCDAMMNLSNEKVEVNVIHRGVGAINDNDVMLAAASEAIIIGFHLRPDPATRQLAKNQNVELKTYDIIYEAVDDVKAAMQGMLAPVDKEVSIGSAEVRELFKVPKVGVIAGSYVLEGEIRRNARVRVLRDQVPVYEGTVASLKRFKEDARTVSSGYECGIGISGYDDIKVGDILEVFEIQQVAQEM